MFAEADFIPLSALQHYIFCPRQCALIHLDRIWEENVLTAEGRVMHDRAHSGLSEKRKERRTVTALMLSSAHLGVSGMADVVEFYEEAGVQKVFPVEYKRGKPKTTDADRVQLCAQAMCLEEMLNIKVEEGALFYGETRRREVVFFDNRLRKLTEEAIKGVRELFDVGKRPPPVSDRRCRACSLKASCLPDLVSDTSERYLQTLIDT